MLELCKNGTLSDLLSKSGGRLPHPTAKRYIKQICNAVQYLHNNGVIHRDLKMGNIFLDHEDNIKLGDFGLCALLTTSHDVEAERRLTKCGTPNYMAPEIFERRAEGHDHRVDIYAIGCILYVLQTCG